MWVSAPNKMEKNYEKFWCHKLVHNFIHNSSMCRIVVGGRVTDHHSSTNHNLPHGQIVTQVVALELLFFESQKKKKNYIYIYI